MESFNKTMNLVREGLQFSLVEAGILVTLLADRVWDGELTLWWVSFVAVLGLAWVVVTCFSGTKENLKELVLVREVFMTDFFVSAFILTLIAIVITPEFMWQMGAILLAVGQNLRYSYLSMQWLLEERRDQRRKERHSDDDMPEV